MIGIPLGLAYCNFGEWFLHKYLLHGLGKNPKSFWRFHWHEHHQTSRRNAMVDDQYTKPRGRWATNAKELLGLAAIVVGHVPLFSRAPFFTATVWYSTVRYYLVHRRAHLDPQWARVHLPWHYDHHMGKDQNANWCVTHPFFDLVLGTRKEFVCTQAPWCSPEGQAGVSPEGEARVPAEASRRSA